MKRHHSSVPPRQSGYGVEPEVSNSMAVSERGGTSKLSDGDEIILVFTDGSDQSQRVAEWALVFADLPRARVRRINVVECLDSDVIIYRDDEIVQNEPGATSWQSTGASTDDEMDQNHEH